MFIKQISLYFTCINNFLITMFFIIVTFLNQLIYIKKHIFYPNNEISSRFRGLPKIPEHTLKIILKSNNVLAGV